MTEEAPQFGEVGRTAPSRIHAGAYAAEMPVISVCLNGHHFPSTFFVGGGASDVTLLGNSELCPTCGVPARVMEGTFDFDVDGLATVLSAPAWTVEALTVARKSVQRLEAGYAMSLSNAELKALRDEVLAEIALRDQGLADVIDGQIKGASRKAAIKKLGFFVRALSAVQTIRQAVEGAPAVFAAVRDAIINMM